jgi:hypothetical protein
MECVAHGLQLSGVNRRVFDCKPYSRNLETLKKGLESVGPQELLNGQYEF